MTSPTLQAELDDTRNQVMKRTAAGLVNPADAEAIIAHNEKIIRGQFRETTAAMTRAARAMLGWSQKKLAHEASLSVLTVHAFEQPDGRATDKSGRAIQSALERGGIEFCPNHEIRPRPQCATEVMIHEQDRLARLKAL